MKELVDTEDRIALARAFYNDSLLALQDRLLPFRPFGRQIVPLQGREESESSAEPK